MTSFRTIGPGNYECLQSGCAYPITPNPARHALTDHGSNTVYVDEPETVTHEEAQAFEKILDTMESGSYGEQAILEEKPAIVATLPAKVDVRPKVVYFRRRQFHGDYETTPKTHIHRGEHPGKYGLFVGHCGYERKNILGDMAISNSIRPPKRSTICRKCLNELDEPKES